MPELSRKKREILRPEKHGSSASDGFFSAFFDAAGRKRNYTLTDIRKELKAVGEDFTKDDFFAPFVHGKYPQILCSNESTHYNVSFIGDALDIMRDIGATVTLEDFTRRHDGESVIAEVLKRDAGNKLFTSQYWGDHLDVMKALWEKIPASDRRGIDFDRHLAQAEALSGPEFEIRKSLKKADLFETNDKGRTPLDDSRTWKKLDKIIEILDGKGESLTKADLMRKNAAGTTYLEVGINAGHQDKLFELIERAGEKITPQDIKAANLGHLFTANNREFWDAAKSDDTAKVKRILKTGMVDVEYVPSDRDYGTAYWQAALDGKTKMLDVLFDAGADPAATRVAGKWPSISASFVQGSDEAALKVIGHIMQRYSDNPAKALAVLTQPNGDRDDPMHHAKRNRSEKVVKALEKAIADVQKLVEKKLAPTAWKGKLDEMRAFWDELPADARKGVNFEDAFGEAFLLTFPIDSSACKEEIFNPKKGQKSPLEFKKGWERLEELSASLAQRGQPITKKDLLRHASDGMTFMQKGIDAGAGEQVFAILATAGERLSKEELLDRNGSGKSIIDALGEKGQLAPAFTPTNWVNDVRSMQEIWARVPRKQQQQLDGKEGRPSFKRLLQEANAASVKALQVSSRAVGE